MKQHNWLFGSLFIGGFECSTQMTAEGRRLDMVAATQHDQCAAEDYQLCRRIGMRAVREAARWPMLDEGGKLRLEEVRRLAVLGRQRGLTQIWDLMHYGYPDDLDPLGPEFTARFAAYASAVARVVRAEMRGPTYYTPINEISYYAWAGGEVGYMAPFWHGRGGELKRALVRAAIAAINAIWEVDPEAVMVNVDPLVRLHPPKGRPDLQAEADFFNHQVVTEGFDLLAGVREPQLGGSRAHLGIVGVNFYAANQWTIPTPEQPQRFLKRDDPNWLPLRDMLAELAARYGGPIVIAETGASGDDRPRWLRYLSKEVAAAVAQGVDVQGICLYPTITSPDWDDPTAFFDGGVFDVQPQPNGSLDRLLHYPTARALRHGQLQLDPANALTLPPAPPSVKNMPAVQLVAPLEQVRFKADNFSHQTLLVGEQLSVELYCFAPGGLLPPHRHPDNEQVWSVLEGSGTAWVGKQRIRLHAGTTLLIPATVYHSVNNNGRGPLVIQQVTAPKLWDARFGAAHPSLFRREEPTP